MDGEGKVDSLVPFADMFNYSHIKQTYWYYDQVKKGFVVKAIANIQKDSEVTVRYKEDITNFHLFLIYGFIYNEMEQEEIEL